MYFHTVRQATTEAKETEDLHAQSPWGGWEDEPTESERQNILAGSTKRRLFGKAGGKGKSGVEQREKWQDE